MGRTFYIGIVGLELPQDSVHLGQNFELRRTEVFLTPQYLVRLPLSPSTSGQVLSGTQVTHEYPLSAELKVTIPASVTGPDGETSADQLEAEFAFAMNYIRAMLFLIRLGVSCDAFCPIVTSRPIASARGYSGQEPFYIFETHAPRVNCAQKSLSPSTISFHWISQNFERFLDVLRREQQFLLAMAISEAALAAQLPEQSYVGFWACLEAIFSPSDSTSEITYRLSANIASYLQSPSSQRLTLIKEVRRLYGMRSKIVHGTLLKSTDESTLPEALSRTYEIVRDCVVRIVEAGELPSAEQLDRLCFGSPPIM